MGEFRTQQFTVVAQAAVDGSQGTTRAAFFAADGSPYLFPIAATATVFGLVKKAAAVADVATANATDLPTAIALANQLKTTVNALLASKRTAGQLT